MQPVAVQPIEVSTRPVAPEEFPEFAAVGFAAYHQQPAMAEAEAERQMIEFDRTLAAFHSGRMVGTSAVLSQQLTLPGGGRAPMAGITWISVRPDCTRRGILSRLMKEQLQAAVDHGEILSGLWASESQIYGRFGFGPATHMLAFRLDTRDAATRVPFVDSGHVRVIEATEAGTILPTLYELYGRRRPGTINRSAGYWSMHLADVEEHRNGGSVMFHALHESTEGEPDGYVSYRIVYREDSGLANNELRVVEVVGAEPTVVRALWRFCLRLDLIRTVSWQMAPVDLALRWELTESRRLLVADLHDSLWLRMLQVAPALEARSYRGEGEMVFEVEDEFLGSAAGRFLLQVGEHASACARTRRRPMLRMGVASLSAAYLGGVSFATLAQAGRVEELQAGSIERADAMFGTSLPPHCVTVF